MSRRPQDHIGKPYMSIRPRSSLLNPELRRPSALDSKPRDPALLWLDKNENLDPELGQTLRDVLALIPTSALTTYPEAGELYRKLAAWVAVSPQSLLLTPGSDGAIRLGGSRHLSSLGIPSPTPFRHLRCTRCTARCSPRRYSRPNISLPCHGPHLEPDTILRSLQERAPKLLCLPNPDSPTGTILQPEVLRSILKRCEEVGTVLLVDEAYHPFYGRSTVSWTEQSEHLIVARTFAKAWGAAGLRVGYAVANPVTIALLHKMRPMYEVSTLAVEVMSRMLDHVDVMTQAVARINAGKARFAAALRAAGFDVLPGEGNFLHVAFGRRARAVHAALAGPCSISRRDRSSQSRRVQSASAWRPEPIMARVMNLIEGAVADVG